MRIYVYGTEEITSNQDKLRLELHDALMKFYGEFDSSEIEFCLSGSINTRIYIIEDTLLKGSSREVISSVQRILGHNSEIFLNYPLPLPDPEPETSKWIKGVLGHNVEILVKSDKKTEKPPRPEWKYRAEYPIYTFDQLILPKKTSRKIHEAIDMIRPEIRHKVFDEWGLKHIVPHAVSALSFYGPPGTGKSMAAEAIAHKLGKKIIRASYADITSKYFGEGSKMVKAIFHEAKLQDAVLFIDEADSLLSKRIADPSDGSGNAINSMRSQLLIALEQFDGVVIFATNLVVNYDRAFISRLISIEFLPPDFDGRKAIWEQHLMGRGINIPMADDVDIDELAKRYDENFYGREIKKAVIRACVSAVTDKRENVTQEDLMTACMNVKSEAADVTRASDYTRNKKILTSSQSLAVKNAVQRLIIK